MKNTISLNGTWQWKKAGDDSFLQGEVPGSVLADLLRLNRIEDPYWRLNEYKTRDLFLEDYMYERTFDVPAEVLKSHQVVLVCSGLDTIADVYLNGRKIAQVNDMHRTYRFDVKQQLQAGCNHIKVYFHSPIRFVNHEDATNDIFYASTGCMKGNGALRKAHYMFGWDWGPQLPDAGIFRDIYLEYADIATLSDVRIRQFHTDGQVRVNLEAAVQRFLGDELHLLAKITAPDGQAWEQKVPVAEKTVLDFVIKNPQLWWPNGYGEHPLYQVDVVLLHGTQQLDCYNCNIGLRTLTVSTQPDEWGSEFAITVNGVKIFAMGANYIPEDNIIKRVTKERSERLVADCARANYNCIRIWGGGYYPDDFMYDACDKYGIIVWQDLMFACNVYRLTEDFEQNIIQETIDNVKRLRHHACMGLWCGNNEMEWGWGEGWARIQGHHPRYKADYIKIFEMVLPRVTQAYDDQTFYWLSSPSSGGSYDDPNDENRGDKHYWEVWHSNKPFTEYRNSYFRFCSEYGFQSFPHIKTINSFCLPEDKNIFSEVMESHQKNGVANSKIFSYVAGYFKYPKDMESISYISQILQLKAIQYGVEHWRRNRGRCMGSIYWQLNDCWPVASWSSIDYYGRWKALHYGAKRFHSLFMVSACEKEELSTEISYYVHNDTLSAKKAKLAVKLIDTDFHVLYSNEQDVEVQPLQVENAFTVDFAAYIKDEEHKKQVFAQYQLIEDGTVISTGSTMFVKPKYFALPQVSYHAHIEETPESFVLHVTSSAFAYYTELYFKDVDCIFSDNYFDITSAEGVTVTVAKEDLSDANVTAEELLDQLCIKSVVDSF